MLGLGFLVEARAVEVAVAETCWQALSQWRLETESTSFGGILYRQHSTALGLSFRRQTHAN